MQPLLKKLRPEVLARTDDFYLTGNVAALTRGFASITRTRRHRSGDAEDTYGGCYFNMYMYKGTRHTQGATNEMFFQNCVSVKRSYGTCD